jgi:hypothetical protein
MAFFTVDVPAWVSAATNIIVSASAPVNVWFNQITPPVGTNPPDIELITGGTSGSFVTLTTNGTPPLIPGQRYYLGVQNPCANASNVTVVLRVNYDITALTNGVPLTNQVLTAGVPERYFSYTVTNANASEVLFQLYNLDGNVDLIARKGAPLPDLFNYDYGSFNSGTSPENILVLTNSSPVALSPGIWYLGVFNRASTNVTYTIRATEVGPPTIIPLTNSVPLDFSSGPGPLLTNFFSFTITNSAPSVLFELYNQSGNGDLVLQRSNLPYASPYFASSANPGSNYEQIVIRTNTLGTDINSTWYLAVLNNDPGLITYTIRAVLPTNGMLISGVPINTGVSIPGGTNVQLTWNPTIPGENYQVQTNIDLTTTNWGVLTTINATGTSIIYVDPTPVSGVPMQFYRIVQVP